MTIISMLFICNVIFTIFNLEIVKSKKPNGFNPEIYPINNLSSIDVSNLNVNISPENESEKYMVYLRLENGLYKKCFHSFNTLDKAKKYAKMGAINCKSTAIVLSNKKEVYKADYRPN